ncbi:hypothetical protein DW954_02490 [Clostridium sp. AM45-5]|nr:hypothetical protein [Clostridium sp. AM45-5]RHS68223.1 hypothetical protein DW954_02490 [Clostridium sp. AM45-5]
MSKYKVGDRVVVISKEEADEKSHVSPGFTDNMKKYCGKVVTIKEVCNDGNYRIEEYGCLWCDKFFEGLEEDVYLKEKPFRYRGTIQASSCFVNTDAIQDMINSFRIVNESFKHTFLSKKENNTMNKKDILAVRNYNDRAMVMQFDKKDKNGKNVQTRAEVHDGDEFDLDNGIRICLLKYLLGGHKEYMAIMDAARKSYKKTTKEDQKKAAEKHEKAITPTANEDKKKEKRDKEIEELITKAIKKALAETAESNDKAAEE